MRCRLRSSVLLESMTGRCPGVPRLREDPRDSSSSAPANVRGLIKSTVGVIDGCAPKMLLGRQPGDHSARVARLAILPAHRCQAGVAIALLVLNLYEQECRRSG